MSTSSSESLTSSDWPISIKSFDGNFLRPLKHIEATIKNYLESRAKIFSSTNIPPDFELYLFQSLENIFKVFSINPTEATDEDLNLAFRCIALQVFIEAKRIPGCVREHEDLSISSQVSSQSILLVNPYIIYETSDNKTRGDECYASNFLGIFPKIFFTKATGISEFTLGNIKNEVESFIPSAIAYLFIKKESFPQIRFVAYLLYRRYWKIFLKTRGKPTSSTLILETLSRIFMECHKSHVLFKSQIDYSNFPHICRLAVLDLIYRARFEIRREGEKGVLTFPNGQEDVFSDQNEDTYLCPRSDEPDVLVTLPNNFHFFRWIDPELAASLNDESLKLKKLILEKPPSFLEEIRNLIITRVLRNIEEASTDPHELQAQAICASNCPSIITSDHDKALRFIARLSVLINPARQESALAAFNHQLEMQSKGFVRKKLFFSDAIKYMSFFEKSYFLNPPRPQQHNYESRRTPVRRGDEGLMSCLFDSLSFHLCEGQTGPWKNKIYYEDQHMTNSRLVLPKNSPLFIANAIALELEKPSVARGFFAHVGSTDGMWVKCSSSEDSEKITAIKKHANNLRKMKVWGGIPDIEIFARIFKRQVYLFTGNINSYQVILDDDGKPIPQATFGEPSINPPCILISTGSHFICGYPKASSQAKKA